MVEGVDKQRAVGSPRGRQGVPLGEDGAGVDAVEAGADEDRERRRPDGVAVLRAAGAGRPPEGVVGTRVADDVVKARHGAVVPRAEAAPRQVGEREVRELRLLVPREGCVVLPVLHEEPAAVKPALEEAVAEADRIAVAALREEPPRHDVRRVRVEIGEVDGGGVAAAGDEDFAVVAGQRPHPCERVEAVGAFVDVGDVRALGVRGAAALLLDARIAAGEGFARLLLLQPGGEAGLRLTVGGADEDDGALGARTRPGREGVEADAVAHRQHRLDGVRAVFARRG